MKKIQHWLALVLIFACTFSGHSWAATPTVMIGTIAELRATVGSPGDSANLAGYMAPGDGAAGPMRVWSNGAVGYFVDNGGSVIVPTGGDGSGAWIWSHSGPVYVEWFGLDSTAPTRAAAYLGTSPGTLMLSARSYEWPASGITLAGGRQHLIGEGQATTLINFTPTADNTPAITISMGEAVANQNSIKNFSIVGGGTKLKIGIRADDTSMLDIDNVAMRNFQNGSIGIQLRGREFTTISRCELGYVDFPVKIEPNVNSGIVDCDHLHIRDSYFLITPGVANYHITIAEDVALTNFVVDGTNAWVMGAGGIYWVDPIGTTAAANITISNVRLETQSFPSSYLFVMDRPAGIQNLQFNNIYGGLGCNGFYLRTMTGVSFKNICYVNSSGGVALNIDDTVWKFTITDSFWQGGSTAVIPDHRLIMGTYPVLGPLTDNGIYEAMSGIGAGKGLMQSASINGDGALGLVLRKSNLYIKPGTIPGTLMCQLFSLWNGDVIAGADNLSKGGTSGAFALDTTGTVLSILDAGITGTAQTVLSTEFQNYTGSSLYSPQAFVNGTAISFNIKSDTGGTNKDLTLLGGFSLVGIAYITK